MYWASVWRRAPGRAPEMASAAATSTEIGEEALPPLQDRPDLGLGLLAEEREQLRIDGVGLREEAQALAEAAYPPRVHDDDGKT